MADWTLPWHYIATPVCLTHVRDTLIEKLKDGTEDPLTVLQPQQNRQAGANPAFLEAAKRIAQSGGVGLFDWTNAWDDDVQLRLRTWDKERFGNFILTPGASLLRWPHDDIPNAPATPALPLADEPDPARDFYSDGFMRVIDYLVATMEGRQFFSKDGTWDGEAPGNGAALGKILGVMHGAGMPLTGVPPNVEVSVENMGTTKTAWEYDDDHFHLHLGWAWEGAGDPPSGSTKDLHILIPEWPCGALS